MKIVINKIELAKALSSVSNVINDKITNPILKGILVEATNGSIEITATNLEQTITVPVTAEVTEPREFVIQEFKLFSEIVKKSDADDIELKIEEATANTLMIKSGRAKFNASIVVVDSKEYPKQDDKQNVLNISVSEKQLKKLFLSTLYAVSDNDTNQRLAGMHITAENEILTCTGCDGHRIANKAINIGTCDKIDIIVIKKAVQDLLKVFQDTDEIVAIGVGDKNICFQTTKIKYYTRLIEAIYPNTNTMVTNEWKTRLTVDRKGLISVINRALIFTSENDKKPVILDIKDGKVTASLKGGRGEFIELVDVVNIEGENIYIAFNPALLVNLLSYEEKDNLEIKFTTPQSPLIVKDETDFSLLLPVNIVQPAA